MRAGGAGLRPGAAAFATAQARFAGGAAVALRRLGEAQARLEADPFDDAARADLGERAHGLAAAARFYAGEPGDVWDDHLPAPARGDPALAAALAALASAVETVAVAIDADDGAAPSVEAVGRWRRLLDAALRLGQATLPGDTPALGDGPGDSGRSAAGGEREGSDTSDDRDDDGELGLGDGAGALLLVQAPGTARDARAFALRAAGFGLRCAGDRAAAAAALRARLPDALLLDAALQGRRPLPVVDQLRASPGGSKPLVALLGAELAFAAQLEAHRRGVDVVLRPGVADHALVDAVGDALRRRRPGGGVLLQLDGDVDATAARHRLLEGAGHRVASWHEPEPALAAALADPPDALVIAAALPGLQGAEWLWLLRQRLGDRTPPALGLVAAAAGGHAPGADADGSDIATARAFDALLPANAPPRTLLAVVERLRGEVEREAARALRDPGTLALTPLALHDRVGRALQLRRRGRGLALALVAAELAELRRVDLRFGPAVGELLLVRLLAAFAAGLPLGSPVGRVGAATLVGLAALDAAGAKAAIGVITERFARSPVYAADGRRVAARLTIAATPARADLLAAAPWIERALADLDAATPRGGLRRNADVGTVGTAARPAGAKPLVVVAPSAPGASTRPAATLAQRSRLVDTAAAARPTAAATPAHPPERGDR